MEQEQRPTRLRDLGIEPGLLPTGHWNAITDVPGVRVGHVTLNHGGQGDGAAVRTGVTAIHPHDGEVFRSMVPAAIEVLNGSGEITGRSQVDEYGLLETPVLITNTFSVGEVHRGVVEWLGRREATLGEEHFVIPVVAETYDGFLNDINGQHVTREHVAEALDGATTGPVPEGCVGGGTGMILFGFKGGIGTSSRQVEIESERFTVGVLVQGNTGDRQELLVDGVPVGREIEGYELERGASPREGSIIIVIGTDAPLTDRQLRRLCKRAILGLGRIGATASHSSGDLILAFSNTPTMRVDRIDAPGFLTETRLNDTRINPLFQATIEATAEAVLNAMVAATTTTGHNGNTVHALPHDQLVEIMGRYGRLRR